MGSWLTVTTVAKLPIIVIAPGLIKRMCLCGIHGEVKHLFGRTDQTNSYWQLCTSTFALLGLGHCRTLFCHHKLFFSWAQAYLNTKKGLNNYTTKIFLKGSRQRRRQRFGIMAFLRLSKRQGVFFLTTSCGYAFLSRISCEKMDVFITPHTINCV